MTFFYSGISLFHDCGIAFQNRYIKRMETSRASYMAVGSAVDAAVNADLTSKMKTGSLLPEDDIRDIATGRMKEQLAQGLTFPEMGWSSTRETAMQAAREMAIFHHREAAPNINPTSIQRFWHIDREGYSLNGYLDIEEKGKIRDTKTNYKTPNKQDANESKQLTMYAMAMNQIDGKLPESVHLDYVVRTPARNEMKLIQLESKRTADDIRYLNRWIEYFVHQVNHGIFKPAIIGHWMCQEKFCGYWDTCPYGRKRASAIAVNPSSL